MPEYITNEIEIASDDSDRKKSDEGNSSGEKHVKDIKIILKKSKTKGKERPEKDIKVLLKNKEEKGITIIRNVSRSYLSIEEITM